MSRLYRHVKAPEPLEPLDVCVSRCGTSNLEVPHLDKQEGDIFLKLNVPKMECKRRKIKEEGERRRSS